MLDQSQLADPRLEALLTDYAHLLRRQGRDAEADALDRRADAARRERQRTKGPSPLRP